MRATRNSYLADRGRGPLLHALLMATGRFCMFATGGRYSESVFSQPSPVPRWIT